MLNPTARKLTREANRLRKQVEILKVEKSEIDNLREVQELRRIKPGADYYTMYFEGCKIAVLLWS